MPHEIDLKFFAPKKRNCIQQWLYNRQVKKLFSQIEPGDSITAELSANPNNKAEKRGYYEFKRLIHEHAKGLNRELIAYVDYPPLALQIAISESSPYNSIAKDVQFKKADLYMHLKNE